MTWAPRQRVLSALYKAYYPVLFGDGQGVCLQVRKVDNVETANYLMERMGKGSATAELIHPDELVAGIISQVAAEPDMGDLLAAFVYTSEGRPLCCCLSAVQPCNGSDISLLCWVGIEWGGTRCTQWPPLRSWQKFDASRVI